MDPPPSPKASAPLKRRRESEDSEDRKQKSQASDVADEEHEERGRNRPVICVISTEFPEDDKKALRILNQAYDRVETLIARHELRVPFLTELEKGNPDVYGFNTG